MNALTRAADVLNEALVWLICGVDYMRTFNIAIVAALAGLSFGTAAKANVVVSAAGPGDVGTGMNFDSQPASTVSNASASFTIGDWTFSNGTEPVQVNILSSNNGAQPLGTTGNYLSVLGGGSENVTFSNRSSFSFFWGSLDNYNTIVVHTTTDGDVTFLGSAIPGLVGNGVQATGCQTLTNCNRYFTFAENDSSLITGFTISSSQNSFELTNISAVPEPATWAMLILGFLGVGLLSYRKSSSVYRQTFRIV